MLKGVKKLINTVSKNEGFVVKIKKALVLSCTLLFISTAYANPVLNNVAAGNVSVQQSPGNTQINQTSQQAILNWNSFNIGASEQTHFQQPAGGVALNRIDPNQGASQIFGHLSATGKIILVNQAGIFFGSGAHVDVGGIIATTSDISDQNFLAGKYTFDQPSAYGGSIVNRGTIIAAENGLVALAGTSVSNEGLIKANTGHVVLASGNKFTVDLSGDQLINFAIDEGTSIAGKSPVDGSTMRDGVSNSGKIIANGGQIILSANVAKEVVDHAINMSGVAVAHSVSEKNGEIILAAEGDATVEVSGKMNVSGRGKGTTGGTVKVLAKHIRVESPAVIKANGDAGGGTILIGGNAHGAGPEPNALDTYVGSGTFLQADALNTGNGGKIVVWSDNATRFYGRISAQGGVLNGDGGFAETSGHYLDVAGAEVNLLAPAGATGNWLLDPSNLTICTSCTTTSGIQFGSIYTAGSTDSNLLVTDLTTALASSNVIVQTSSSGSGSAGDILVNTIISYSSSNSLTLSAYRNIDTTGIAASSGHIINNTGTGAVKLIADNSGTGTGTVVAFNSGNDISASGGISIYYNPTTFGTQNTIYSGDSTVGNTFATKYMLINSLGTSSDSATTASLGALSNPSNSSLWGGNYALSKNIDATNTNNGTGWSTTGFSPIGNSTTAFTGKFDGLNHTVSNLYENVTSSIGGDIGFFGDVSTGTIQNLNLSSESINVGISGVNVGGLLGELTSTGTVSNVSTGGTITLNSNPTSDFIGGLIGQMGGGTLNGGSYSTDTISANSSSISGNGFIIGGAVGLMVGSSTATNSYSAGSISSAVPNGTGQFFIGGFVGQTNAAGVNVTNDYSLTSITVSSNTSSGGNNNNVGGFLGLADPTGSISNSYSSGSVSATLSGSSNNLKGGFAGAMNNTSAVSNDLWDVVTSGMTAGYGALQGSASISHLYGGCMAWGGTCASATLTHATNAGSGVTPVNLSVLASYTTAGWSSTAGASGSITSTASTTSAAPNFTWFIFPNETRPLLVSEWTTNITNGHQLQLMGAALGSVGNAPTYQLANSINLSSQLASAADIWGGTATNSSSGTPQGFVPVGNSGTAFLSSFNGQNFTISNMTISSSANDVGLFGNVGSGSYTGEIQNFTLSNPSVTSSGTTLGGVVGLITGSTSSTVLLNNITVSGGTISSTSSGSGVPVGGVVGDLSTGKLTNLSNSATVTSTNSEVNAGILGQGTGSIQINSASNSGTITSDTSNTNVENYAAGIVGAFSSTGSLTISNSSNTGTITGGPASEVGGIVGQINGNGPGSLTISNSYNTGNILTSHTSSIGSADGIGGLVGSSYTANLTINSSYNVGNVTTNDLGSLAGSLGIGGILGWWADGGSNTLNFGTSLTTGVFNTGTITGIHLSSGTRATYTGGLLGEYNSSTGTANIYNSYNTGAISGANSSSFAGGLVGASATTLNITTSYNAGSVSGSATNGTILGQRSSGTTTLSNVFWDNQTSTATSAVGSGTFSGSATGYSTANMQSNSSGLPYAIFNAAAPNVWGIIPPLSGVSYTYPFLQTLTQGISGKVENSSGTAVSGFAVSVAEAGSALSLSNSAFFSPSSSATTDANGVYYFLISNLAIPNTNPLLLSATVTGTGAGTGNTVVINSGNTYSTSYPFTIEANNLNAYAPNATIANSDLGTALGSLSGSSYLYSNSSNNLTVNSNVNFNAPDSSTTYNLNGNLTTAGTGTISFASPVSLGAASTLTTANQGITFSSTVNGAQALTFANSSGSSATVTFNGIVGGSTPLSSLAMGTGDTAAINTTGISKSGNQTYGAINLGANTTLTASSGNLTFNGAVSGTSNSITLSAQNAANSITTGSNGTFNVGTFKLSAGQWVQNGTLPAFTVTTDFELNGGSFLRATSGSGTTLSPYVVTDIYGLQGIGTLLSSNFNLGANINATSDASGHSSASWNSNAGFVPIGTSSSPFTGSFNGNSDTISNLTISNNSAQYIGLFGYVGGSSYAGEIQNLTLSSPSIASTTSSQFYLGSLAGYIQSSAGSNTVVNNVTVSGGAVTLTNSSAALQSPVGGLIGKLNTGTVSNVTNSSTDSANGFSFVGGIVGWAMGTDTISSATNSGSITSGQVNKGGSGELTVGGIVGLVTDGIFGSSVTHSNVTISSSNNSGTIQGGKLAAIGGILGDDSGDGTTSTVAINSSYNTGSISPISTSTATEAVGGLVGVEWTSTLNLSNSYNLASVTGNDSSSAGNLSIGGLLGWFSNGSSSTNNTSTISSSFNAGSVSGTQTASNTNGDFVGGILGRVLNSGSSGTGSVSITNSYNLGAVTGVDSNTYVGGILGQSGSGTVAPTTMTNSYNAGYLSATSNHAGGIVGNVASGTVTASNVFWNTDTSGLSSASGSGTLSGTATGKTTPQMMQQTTFCPSGNCSGDTSHFDFANNWGIVAGDGTDANGSYPYLTGIFTSTPRIVSGSSGLGGNATVTLNAGGSAVTTVKTGNNGFYYFQLTNGTVADSAKLLAYGTNEAAIAIAPAAATNGGRVTGLTLSANTLNVGQTFADSAQTISNADIISAASGSLSSALISSTSGNDITLTSGSSFAANTKASGSFSDITLNLNGNITAAGSGTLTFNGPISLGAGSVLSATSATFNGAIATGGYILTMNNSGSASLSGLTGSGGLTMSGSGTLTLSGSNSYTGPTSVTAGTLQMGIANAISSSSPVSVSSGATFALASNDQTIGSLAGAGTVSLGSAALTLGGDNSSTTFSGAINGTGSLVKNGSGTLTLSGSNSYQGGTTLNAGSISLSNSSGLGTGTATIANNATLTIASALGSAVANNFNLAGTINDLGSNTLSGAITLAGDSTISTASALTVSGAINGGSALTLSGTGSLTLNGPVGNNTNLSSISATVNSLTLGGGSVKTTGAQNNSNSFTISSDTTLSMMLGGNMTLNGVSGSGKNLTLVGNGTAFALNNGTYNLNSATITGSSGTNSLSAQTSGSQTWAITGTNTGTVSNVSNIGNVGFSGIQTITGNTSQSNTLDFSNYSSPVNFVLSSASGTSSGSAGTMNFSNINNLVASSSMPASITLPNKSSGSVIVITGVNSTAAVGYINDPINFSNANAFYGSSNDSVQFASGVNPVPTGINTLSVNGTSLQFFNMILPSTVSAAANSIASIVSGGSSNSNDNTNGTSQTSATDSQQVFTTFTAQMQSVTQPVTKAFDIDLTKTPIHLHCG